MCFRVNEENKYLCFDLFLFSECLSTLGNINQIHVGLFLLNMAFFCLTLSLSIACDQQYENEPFHNSKLVFSNSRTRGVIYSTSEKQNQNLNHLWTAHRTPFWHRKTSFWSNDIVLLIPLNILDRISAVAATLCHFSPFHYIISAI